MQGQESVELRNNLRGEICRGILCCGRQAGQRAAHTLWRQQEIASMRVKTKLRIARTTEHPVSNARFQHTTPTGRWQPRQERTNMRQKRCQKRERQGEKITAHRQANQEEKRFFPTSAPCRTAGGSGSGGSGCHCAGGVRPRISRRIGQQLGRQQGRRQRLLAWRGNRRLV